jgi:micrococcal nuclease
MKMRMVTLIFLALFLTDGLQATGSQQLQEALVTRVVDGDTIIVRMRGSSHRVRLIGVDTPEVGQPFTFEATAFTRRWLDGQQVWLEEDVQLWDRYSRRLAYIWLQQPRDRTLPEVRAKMFNAIIVAEGYAQLLTIPPNVRYVDMLRVLQTEAREKGRGLWRGNQPQVTQPDCDPSYPDVCIPPPPPDLDCADIPYRKFRVLSPDPHRFDRDGDGVGCER